MLTVCYSPKGGQGCTTVAVALACLTTSAWLIDTAGDAAALAGITESTGDGICDLLAGGGPVTAEHVKSLVLCGDGLTIIPAGNTQAATIPQARWAELAVALADAGPVIVDAATDVTVAAMPTDRRIMVVQACYLALRRAARCPVRPDAVVAIADSRRALDTGDVTAVAGAPVIATIPFDPTVGRAVDAGVLSSAVPRVLKRTLTSRAMVATLRDGR